MLAKRAFFVAAALVLSPAVGACKKTPGSRPVAPAAAPGAKGDGGLAEIPPAKPGPKVHIQASIEDVDDIFAAVKDVGQRIAPDEGIDPLASLGAMLVQTGFAPTFLGNVDLQGMHVLSAAWPVAESSGTRDAELAASISVVDPRKVIEGTPAAFRPQPLGDGVWELQQDDLRLLLQEAGKELRLGFSPADLDHAAKLRAEVGQGRRFRARASGLPTDWIDPTDILGLPRGTPLADNLAKVAQQLQAIELEAELGTKEDFELLAEAQAPFHLLGVDPLGAPRGAATALEGRLPGDPTFVASVSWGKPELLHQTMKRLVPLDQIPQPFGDIVVKALDGAHGLLDQVANDVVVALYVDDKGQASVVLAADVRDEAATIAAVRKIDEAIVAAIEAQATTAGKNKAAQFGVEYKPDGIGLPGGKADRVVVKIPKDFESDFDDAALFLKKNTIETIAFVRDKTAVVAIGSGARNVAADVARSLGKPRKDSLAEDDGLARIRKTMGGCRICFAGDPVDYLRFRLLLLKASTDDKGVAKDAKAKLGELGKVGDIGESAAGLAVGKDDASVGMVVPQATVFAEAKAWTQLRDVASFLDEPGAPPEVAPPGPPGSVSPPAGRSEKKKEKKPEKKPEKALENEE